MYFGQLSHTLPPLRANRLFSLPTAFAVGLLGSFLSFGAAPLTLMLYTFLFAADEEESTIGRTDRFAVCDGGQIDCFIDSPAVSASGCGRAALAARRRGRRFAAGDAPALQGRQASMGSALLRLSLFTSLLNIAAALT